jgi:hypothetical protein
LDPKIDLLNRYVVMLSGLASNVLLFYIITVAVLCCSREIIIFNVVSNVGHHLNLLIFMNVFVVITVAMVW